MNNAQSGATIVEFALSLLIFLTFLLGITDFSRMLFTWSAANEATQIGARFAVVCDDTNNKDKVLAKMQGLLPQITDIELKWVPDTPTQCTSATCEGVRVTITGLNYQWISPVAGVSAIGAIRMPAFSTYLPREVMKQDPNSVTKICT